MATSSTPAPHGHGDDGDDDRGDRVLSARERQILAGIEQDLATADPALAREMRGRAEAPGWWPLSARAAGLLLVVLSVLVLAGAFVPSSWWPVTGLITTLVVVPWLLFAAYEDTGARQAGEENADRRNSIEKEQPG